LLGARRRRRKGRRKSERKGGVGLGEKGGREGGLGLERLVVKGE